jgi:predicted metal-dependent RNase
VTEIENGNKAIMLQTRNTKSLLDCGLEMVNFSKITPEQLTILREGSYATLSDIDEVLGALNSVQESLLLLQQKGGVE